MEKIKRILFKILLVVCIINILNINTVKVEAGFWDQVIGLGTDFLREGKEESLNNSYVSDGETAQIITILFNSLLTLGVIITVAIGGVLGIKFMTSSAEDKAKIKESMVPYVIGSAVIFGSLAIWKISITIFSQMEGM